MLTNIYKGKLDVEQMLQKFILQDKDTKKEDACMKFYYETKPLCGDGCIWIRARGRTTINHRWNELSTRYNTWQHHP